MFRTGEEEDGFHLWSSEAPLEECRRRGKGLITRDPIWSHTQKPKCQRATRTPDRTRMSPDDTCDTSPSQIAAGGPALPSALRSRSGWCGVYPMLLPVVAGSFTSLMPGSLPRSLDQFLCGVSLRRVPGFKGNLDTVFMGVTEGGWWSFPGPGDGGAIFIGRYQTRLHVRGDHSCG